MSLNSATSTYGETEIHLLHDFGLLLMTWSKTT